MQYLKEFLEDRLVIMNKHLESKNIENRDYTRGCRDELIIALKKLIVIMKDYTPN